MQSVHIVTTMTEGFLYEGLQTENMKVKLFMDAMKSDDL